ncbi:transposase [bacterium 210820-DFI.6.37]|nr:transposase [bacterium 210820-DFI.6.37]
MKKQIGKIDRRVINLLNLSVSPDTPIYIGDSNIQHMKSSHPKDYAKYNSNISDILNSPDYVATNPKDGSIEYVKEFKIDDEYVKVAVRVSGKGTYYARSMYILNKNRVKNFIKKKTLLKY